MKRDVQDVKGVESMVLKKLSLDEHIRTRQLWEEIFKEDTSEFLDYYYSEKAKDNEIYVIEDNGEIVSMLHLNPYQMRIGNEIYPTHYIVAVATKEQYRKQGLMRQLLNCAMQVMKDRGELFTFLMPASEAIYKPFGFRFIYEQKQGELTGIKPEDTTLVWEEATKEDCHEIATFSNKKLQDYQVVTWRDAAYYQTLLSELKSEQGGILLAKRNGKLQGVFCYAYDQEVMIREPLCQCEQELRYAIYRLTGSETEKAKCIGYGAERKPIIMAKVLNPNLEIDLQKAEVFINEVV